MPIAVPRLLLIATLLASSVATTLYAQMRQPGSPTAATVQRSVTDDDALIQRLEMEGVRLERKRATLWIEPGTMSPAQMERFADRIEAGLPAVEAFVGAAMDSQHYAGDSLRVYVATAIAPSHVYGGYQHPRFKRAAVFFPAGQVAQNNEPYLHELTHIVLRPFGSHTLREGFANLVHLSQARHGGQGRNFIYGGVGNRAAADRRSATLMNSPAGPAILDTLGRPGIPGLEQALGNERIDYYIASYSFVAFLVDKLGQPAFLQLHAADDPEAEILRLSQRSMALWRDDWLAHIGAPHP